MIRAICDKCGKKAENKLAFKKYPINMSFLFISTLDVPDATLDICNSCYMEMIKKTADYSQVAS